MEQEISVRLWAGIWNPGKEVLLGTAGWGLRDIRGHALTGVPDTGVASRDCGQGYGARERGATGDCWAGFRGIRGWWVVSYLEFLARGLW